MKRDPFDRAQRHVLWALWLTYGAFYFCRNDLSSAAPGLGTDELLTKSQIGWILGALKLAYGVGQLINGQLAERVPARRLLAIGMFGSAALNVVFGLGTGFYFFLFVWACNGYVQALGWAPTMRVAATWFAPERRGRAIAFIGTGYLTCGALTFVVAGGAADLFGWRGATIVPAIVLAAAGVVMLLTLREAPPGVTPPSARADHPPWRDTLAITLANPRLWFLALALALLNACRYGFVDWGISHLREVQPASVGVSALKYSVLPLGGIAGTLFAGWSSDRLFRGRRIPVVCAMLVTLAAVALGYDAIVRSNLILSIVTLALIGALIFGPQVLLVGAAPVDLARAGTAAAAVGFVDFVGYLGAAAGDQITGALVDTYDWHAALYFWAACALGAAILVVPLWRTRAGAS
jgi:MFS transporter, OPA family, glycerol-3-phosphate transporter